MSIYGYDVDSQSMDVSSSNQSVFSATLPYIVGSLAVAGLGTWAAVSAFTAGSTVLAVVSVAAALFGAYGFLATAILGIYSKNSDEFKKNIGPLLAATALTVVTEMIATVAKEVFARLISNALFGGRR